MERVFKSRLQVDVPHTNRRKNDLLHLKRLQNDVKRQSWQFRCREHFNQYLLNTTLHGLKYVGDRKCTRQERLFFAIMFIMVLTFSAYFITNVWNRWNESPLVVTLSAISTSIKDLPFPAVTICNVNQAQKSAVSRIARETEEYSVVQSICRYSVDENVTNSVAGSWDIFRKVLLKVAQPCDQMLIGCHFGGFHANCSNIFSSILTDGGVCCIFNGVHRRFMTSFSYNRSENFNNNDYLEKMANEWTPETGFRSETLRRHKDGYPRPGVGSGNHLGLSVILNATIDEYYCSSTSGFGFKVLLHSPHELPEVDHYGIGIANGYESRIITAPVVSTASEAVRKVSVNIRNCLFENENFLSLYRIYSRRNCQSECEMKIYRKSCGCVLYYMPRPHHNLTICGRRDSACVDKVKKAIRSERDESFMCDCLYACYAIRYEMSLSSTPIFNQAPLLKSAGIDAENAAILHIYYQSSYHRSQKKEQLVGLTEFLSNIGGLLGLFMGFSVFSIIEVLYFLSIRPYCHYLRDNESRRQTIQRLTQRFKRIRSKEPTNTHQNFIMENAVFPHLNWCSKLFVRAKAKITNKTFEILSRNEFRF